MATPPSSSDWCAHAVLTVTVPTRAGAGVCEGRVHNAALHGRAASRRAGSHGGAACDGVWAVVVGGGEDWARPSTTRWAEIKSLSAIALRTHAFFEH